MCSFASLLCEIAASQAASLLSLCAIETSRDGDRGLSRWAGVAMRTLACSFACEDHGVDRERASLCSQAHIDGISAWTHGHARHFGALGRPLTGRGSRDHTRAWRIFIFEFVCRWHAVWVVLRRISGWA